ncbi:hypothetical protein MMC13_001501 [Lambiella insularis]|nr:hypothetical protein [Lambiella insularis]
MTFTTATKSRRRPATYSKASRQKTEACQGSRTYGISNDSREDIHGRERTISGRIRKDEGGRPPGLCRGSPHSSVEHDEPLSSVRNESVERSVTPVIVGSDRRGSFQSQVIYDVSSSDDPESGPLRLRLAASRKRRKINATSIAEYTDTVWDDDSLQRHIAAEAAVITLHTRNVAKPQIPKGISPAQSLLEPQKGAKRRSTKSGEAGTSGLVKPSIGTKNLKKQKVLGTSAPLSKSKVHHGYVPAQIRSTAVARCLPLSSTADNSNIEISRQSPCRPQAQISQTLRLQDRIPIDGSFASRTTDTRSCNPEETQTAKYTSFTARNLRSPQPTAQTKVIVHSPSHLKVHGLHLGSALNASKITRCESQNLSLTSPLRVKIKDRLYPLNNSSPFTEDASDPDENDSESSARTFEKNDSAKVVSKHEPQTTDSIPIGRSQSSNSTEVPSRKNGGLKVTYARQRSYLSQDSLGSASSLNLLRSDVDETKTKARPARIKPYPLKGINHTSQSSTVMDESIEINVGAIRSIHELREAGSNARMTEEIEAVLDDIDEKQHISISIRRTGLLNVAVKLQQPDFCRRFRDLSLESRLLSQVGSSTDPISDILLLASLLQILAQSDSLPTLSQFAENEVVDFFAKFLEDTDDLTTMVRHRKSNMSKALQADVNAFCTSFLASSIWRGGQPTNITSQVLSLQSLEYLERHLRKVEVQFGIISNEIVQKLVDIIMPGERDASIKSEIRPSSEVHLSLSILESSSLARISSIAEQEAPWTSDAIAKMTQILAIIQLQLGPKAEVLRTLALRLCLNLTNNNAAICQMFSSPMVIHATLFMLEPNFHICPTNIIEVPTELLVDNLVLSLGLLINLAEWSQSTRELFLHSHEDKPPPLDILSQIFEYNLERTSEVISEQDIALNIPFGYLAVLLSFLCMSISVRQRIHSRLKGQMFRRILGAVEEFLNYHRQIVDEIHETADGVDLKANFINRVQSVVTRLILID